jgi:hypothetical protein
MRKIGYSFIGIAFFYLPVFEYKGYLSSQHNLIIKPDFLLQPFGSAFLFYLCIGFVVLVLSTVFFEGSQLKEENELTV